jgi:multiple sugar transport system ATP-binding protein
MARVDISPVRKSFGATEVLHGVDVTIRDGDFVILVGRAGDEEIHAVFHERHSFAPGEHIHLIPDVDHVHLFARESGMRLES